MLTESLFKPVNGRTLSRERYDRGKYRSDVDFVGRQVETPDHVVALWTERRSDIDGPYKALFCLRKEAAA